MSNGPSSNPEEKWEDKVNRVAALVLHEAHSHDDFFNKIEAWGVTFPTGKHFNNFVAGLSNPSGYKMPTIISIASLFREQKSIDITRATAEEVHELFEDIFSDMNILETLKNDAGLPEKEVVLAIAEYCRRHEAMQKRLQQQLPPYCRIADPELKIKYQEQDKAAKEFVFQIAKEAMLKGQTFYDIWH